MARGDIGCPLCSQILGLPTVALRPGSVSDPRAKEVGGHCHLAVSGSMTCPNGHQWALDGDILITRTA